jgi:uncharacterized protein (TIGR01777 family)
VKQKVLITGGTGLIGQAVIKLLQQEGYEPVLLSRSAGNGQIKTYQWNVSRSEIDTMAIQQADHIIHLAGASVAGRRWTKKYKQEIIDSRVRSAEVLREALIKSNHKVKSFICPSGIGWFGERGNDTVTEEQEPGTDFLADVCRQWEAAADALTDVADRVVKLRTGIVLSPNGGALPQMTMPMKFRISIIFGSGQQYYSWIHIDDIARMYIFALQNNISGVFNAVAPNPVSYNELIAVIEKARNIHTLKIHLPLSFLKIPLGEFAETLYQSIKVSAAKIQESGFVFEKPTLAPPNLPYGEGLLAQGFAGEKRY